MRTKAYSGKIQSKNWIFLNFDGVASRNQIEWKTPLSHGYEIGFDLYSISEVYVHDENQFTVMSISLPLTL